MAGLRIIPLGGMGKVTQNMYVYEYEDEMLIVDCGIGFPDMFMPGVDILIPDTTYLHDRLEMGKQIVGMILTHAHDDHIAATPYILPELPDFPIYGSPLTAGFAENRLAESEASHRQITVFKDNEKFKIGQYFEIEAFPMTHSVPDTRHFAIHTPVGLVYHGTDFKIDLQPVDGVLPDFDTISRLGNENVLCLLMDCLRVEREGWTKSESAVGPALDYAIEHTKGKAIVTLMSSHIHRIQQVVDVAEATGRKVAFIGRSVEQNVEVALRLGKLEIPDGVMIDKRDTSDYSDKKLILIVAGSQGQEGSSLVRAVYGDHPQIQIKSNDRVIFSSDVIPGNEIPYYGAIDELARNGIEVLYPDILPDLHQSGHGGAMEQQMLLALVKPQYVMPIGGQDRHREKFLELVASKMGFYDNEIIIPSHGEVLELNEGSWRISDTIELKSRIVDGLGIGDVGRVVLADRKVLGEDGMIVVILRRDKDNPTGFDLGDITIESRGFVFMKEAEDVVKFLKDNVAEIVNDSLKLDEEELRRKIEKKLARKLHKIIQRTPMILPVFVG